MSNFRDFVVRSALAACVLGAGIDPGLAADESHGEQLARRWCASCHVVADDQTRGTDNVPTFAAIAKRPNLNADEIARFLRNPHPVMPDMDLSVPESSDLAAYIASLAK